MSILTTAGNFILGINYRKFGKKVFDTTMNGMQKNSVTHTTAAVVGGVAAYNIVDSGLDRGREKATEELASDYTDLFRKSQTSSYESNLLEKTKIFVRNRFFDNESYPIYKNIKNAVLSTAGECLNHITTIGAVAGVFIPAFSKSTNPVVKKIIPAISTGVLLFNTGKTFVLDVLGVGKK